MCWLELEGFFLALKNERDWGKLFGFTPEPANHNIPPGLTGGQIFWWIALLFTIYRHTVDVRCCILLWNLGCRILCSLLTLGVSFLLLFATICSCFPCLWRRLRCLLAFLTSLCASLFGFFQSRHFISLKLVRKNMIKNNGHIFCKLFNRWLVRLLLCLRINFCFKPSYVLHNFLFLLRSIRIALFSSAFLLGYQGQHVPSSLLVNVFRIVKILLVGLLAWLYCRT